MKLTDLKIKKLRLPGNWKAITADPEVETIASSIADNGQIEPIMVNGATWEIIAGRKRVAAAVRLKHKTVLAIVVETDPAKAKCIEIAENAHRTHWTASERAEAIAAYVEARTAVLSAEKPADEDLPPPAPKKTAVKEAADAWGVSERTVERAIKNDEPKPESLPNAFETFGLTLEPQEIAKVNIVRETFGRATKALKDAAAAAGYIAASGGNAAFAGRIEGEVLSILAEISGHVPVALCPWCKMTKYMATCQSCGGSGMAGKIKIKDAPRLLLESGMDAKAYDENGDLVNLA